MMTTNLLAARPVLDRRSSHTGVVTLFSGQANGRRVSHTVGLSPRASQGGHHLDVPHARSRGSSLPGNIELVNQVFSHYTGQTCTSAKILVLGKVTRSPNLELCG